MQARHRLFSHRPLRDSAPEQTVVVLQVMQPTAGDHESPGRMMTTSELQVDPMDRWQLDPDIGVVHIGHRLAQLDGAALHFYEKREVVTALLSLFRRLQQVRNEE